MTEVLPPGSEINYALVTIGGQSVLVREAIGQYVLPPANASWIAGTDPNGVPIFVAPFACRVTGVIGRLEVAEGGAATIQLVKAASGTSISAGTALTSNTLNANGTEATNQTLTLSSTPADLLLAVGDCIGVVTTGAWTTSVGAIQAVLVPAP